MCIKTEDEFPENPKIKDNLAQDKKYSITSDEKVETSPFGTEGIFINNEDYPSGDNQ